MKRALIFVLMLSSLVECKEREDVTPEVRKTHCVSNFKDLRRTGNPVRKAPVLFVEGKFYYLTHLDSADIDLRYAVPFLPCNLPNRYQKDTLTALVSGYHLTNDFLELANVIPLPFELTDIEARK